MRAGRLRHRLTLRKPVYGDDWGEVPTRWIDVATVWGAVEPVRGQEYTQLRSSGADETGKIVIRYRSDVHPEMRVAMDGSPEERVYDIKDVIDPDERHRELQLMVKEFVG